MDEPVPVARTVDRRASDEVHIEPYHERTTPLGKVSRLIIEVRARQEAHIVVITEQLVLNPSQRLRLKARSSLKSGEFDNEFQALYVAAAHRARYLVETAQI